MLKRLLVDFIMQRHSGRDGVGVLQHAEELECARVCMCVWDRKRHTAAVLSARKKGELKRKRGTFIGENHIYCPRAVLVFLDLKYPVCIWDLVRTPAFAYLIFDKLQTAEGHKTFIIAI